MIINAKYSTLAELPSENRIAVASSVAVYKHHDPTKVWILSFDYLRYDFYKLLGIEVGARYTRSIPYIYEDMRFYAEVDLFECERMSEASSLDANYVAAKEHIEDLDSYYWLRHFGDTCLLPQQNPVVHDWLYAFLAVYGGYEATLDTGTYNALRNRAGQLFLTDFVSIDELLDPYGITINTDDFNFAFDIMRDAQEEKYYA